VAAFSGLSPALLPFAGFDDNAALSSAGFYNTKTVMPLARLRRRPRLTP